MPKLNDTQTIMLSVASQRENRNLYPLPESVKAGARVTKAISGLIIAGFAEQHGETEVLATDAGLAAIGVDVGQGASLTAVAEPSAREQRASKTASVISLLGRETGATMPELIAATGWLPHTTRAALTGLRKKGHAIELGKRNDQTCYRIVVAG